MSNKSKFLGAALSKIRGVHDIFGTKNKEVGEESSRGWKEGGNETKVTPPEPIIVDEEVIRRLGRR